MRCLLIPVFCVLALTPAIAAAEADTITVIQDDGKAVTVDIDAPEPILPGPKPEATPAPFDLPPVTAAPPAAPKTEKPVAKPKKKPVKKAEKPAAPPAKPKAQPIPPREPAQKAVQRTLKPGGRIYEPDAIAIALEHAPASSAYSVSRSIYRGLRVYVVTFKTENGPYDVVIDAGTGNVLLSAPVEDAPAAPTLPGHLPKD